MWLWANDITTAWGGVPNGTLSMMFTCCPNLMFLAYSWLEIHRFSNWLFYWTLMFILLTLGKSKLTLFIPFYCFGQVTALLLSLVKTCHKKQSKPSQFDKNSRTKHRIRHFSNYFNDSISGNQELVSSVNK